MRILAGAVVALSSARPVAAAPKRDAPDYDGRGNTDTDADSWALWIPRLALSPLYLVNEYVVRRPLGGLVTVAERRHWVNAVSDFFTFGSDNNYVVVPTVLFDFGLLPSAGVYFAGDRAWAAGNTIRLHAATWGADWINATALDRFTWNGGSTSGDKLRLSADLGVISIGKRDQGLEVLFGVGTETLEQGAGITSVRLSFGSRKGF